MGKWISEWVLLSMILVLGAVLVFVLWAIWPLLPGRLPVEILTALNTEGLLAMGMLLAIALGFGKLMLAK